MSRFTVWGFPRRWEGQRRGIRLLGGILLGGLLILGGCAPGSSSSSLHWQESMLPFNPRTYVVQRTLESPEIDGQLTDSSWREAEWTAPFVNTRGPDYSAPPFRTRAKMMWDDDYLYVAAQLEEPHVRAEFTTREASDST